jgi:hypothetical protein
MTHLYFPTIADVRAAIDFWASDDAPGSPEMRYACIHELERIALLLIAETN